MLFVQYFVHAKYFDHSNKVGIKSVRSSLKIAISISIFNAHEFLPSWKHSANFEEFFSLWKHIVFEVEVIY